MSFSPYNDYWKELRKLCARELFSAKQIHSFQPIKDEEIKKVIAQISESASLNHPVNLSKTFLALTVSVVCKAAFGVSFEGTVLSNDRFNKLVRDAFETLGSFSATDFIPHVGWIIDQFTGLQKMREKSVRDLDAFYEQLFDLHKEGDRQGREDFVDMLLRFEKEGTVVGTDNLTRNHIKAILMVRYKTTI